MPAKDQLIGRHLPGRCDLLTRSLPIFSPSHPAHFPHRSVSRFEDHASVLAFAIRELNLEIRLIEGVTSFYVSGCRKIRNAQKLCLEGKAGRSEFKRVVYVPDEDVAVDGN